VAVPGRGGLECFAGRSVFGYSRLKHFHRSLLKGAVSVPSDVPSVLIHVAATVSMADPLVHQGRGCFGSSLHGFRERFQVRQAETLKFLLLSHLACHSSQA